MQRKTPLNAGFYIFILLDLLKYIDNYTKIFLRESIKIFEVFKLDRQILEEIKSKLAREIKPKAIILFGSMARREEKEDSDFDLLIIWDEVADIPNVKRRIAIRKAIGFVDKPVDIITCTTDELANALKDRKSFTSHIIKEGVVIYGRLDGLSEMDSKSKPRHKSGRDN